jgi:hypothetical protein
MVLEHVDHGVKVLNFIGEYGGHGSFSDDLDRDLGCVRLVMPEPQDVLLKKTAWPASGVGQAQCTSRVIAS